MFMTNTELLNNIGWPFHYKPRPLKGGTFTHCELAHPRAACPETLWGPHSKFSLCQ